MTDPEDLFGNTDVIGYLTVWSSIPLGWNTDMPKMKEDERSGLIPGQDADTVPGQGTGKVPHGLESNTRYTDDMWLHKG
ncbi:hypothetical protein MMC12_002985 [Toensbergia leucococca]|nr:hypothetical protein [Toensbergia leucococca]